MPASRPCSIIWAPIIKVLVEKVAGVLLVGADAADDRGQVDHDARARIAVDAAHGL
jgi:hypothetical protein